MKKCNESCSGCPYIHRKIIIKQGVGEPTNGCKHLRRKILKDKVLYAAWCELHKKDVSEKNEVKHEEEKIHNPKSF